MSPNPRKPWSPSADQAPIIGEADEAHKPVDICRVWRFVTPQ